MLTVARDVSFHVRTLRDDVEVFFPRIGEGSLNQFRRDALPPELHGDEGVIVNDTITIALVGEDRVSLAVTKLVAILFGEMPNCGVAHNSKLLIEHVVGQIRHEQFGARHRSLDVHVATAVG